MNMSTVNTIPETENEKMNENPFDSNGSAEQEQQHQSEPLTIKTASSRPSPGINTVLNNEYLPNARKSSNAASARSPVSMDSFDMELDPHPLMSPQVRDGTAAKCKRLVLCFDGTGNKFHGGGEDTNIIKMYQMLDKHDISQYMYYQPGIGTYISGEHDFDPGPIARVKRFFRKSFDEAVGSSFDHHVIAGYSFLVQYFTPGDKIYVFGFSRGAYTARFLSQMVQNIGLLNRGNEELIPFAYKSFAKHERLRKMRTQKANAIRRHMAHFKDTFCRPGARVYLLGLYDTVNSVGRFEIPFFRKTFPEDVAPAADHIRHAVAIDERRAKFKPALYAQSSGYDPLKQDVKEVWFPGNHADIGGGWNLEEGRPLISDITLGWMLKEIIEIEDEDCGPHSGPHGGDRLSWKMEVVKELWRKNDNAMGVPTIHDALKFGGGWGRAATLSWWIIEVLPIFTRLELDTGRWAPMRWPPNLGLTRDIPNGATYHESVHDRERAGLGYKPKNLGYRQCQKLSYPELEAKRRNLSWKKSNGASSPTTRSPGPAPKKVPKKGLVSPTLLADADCTHCRPSLVPALLREKVETG